MLALDYNNVDRIADLHALLRDVGFTDTARYWEEPHDRLIAICKLGAELVLASERDDERDEHREEREKLEARIADLEAANESLVAQNAALQTINDRYAAQLNELRSLLGKP